MSVEDHEKAYRYLEREFRAGEDYFIGCFLVNDINDARKEGRKNILDFLFMHHRDFYKELFTTIFVRPKRGFYFYNDILPYLKLKDLLAHLRSIIPKAQGTWKERLLDLYQHYHNHLVWITVVVKYADRFPSLPDEIREMPLINTYSDDWWADPQLIEESRKFLGSYDRNTPRVFENIILGLPTDIGDELEYQYGFLAREAKKDFHEAQKMIAFYKAFIDDLVIGLRQLDLAERLVDLLIGDFGDNPVVEKLFLGVKAVGLKLDDVKSHIETKYSEEEIQADPQLLTYLSEYYQLYGEITKAVELSKMAYEVSDYDTGYLKEYCKVLLLRDPEESKKVLEDFIRDGKNVLLPSQILFLIPRFLRVDIEFAKRLLDYYGGKYPSKDPKNRGLNHIQYLHFLSRYFEKREDYSLAVRTLEEVVKEYPDWEGGYRKLMEFRSRYSLPKFFDLKNALCYGEKCALVRGIGPEYYRGICYLNAEEWEKGIEELERFVSEGEIHPAYSRAYLHLFRACLKIKNKKVACKWAGKYLEIFDLGTRLQMYRDPTMDTESLLANDLVFFHLVAKTCPKLKSKAERYLKERKFWENATRRSIELHNRTLQNEELKKRIGQLEKELQDVKAKYHNVDLEVEKNVEAFFEEIESRALDLSEFHRRLNQKLWVRSRKDLESLVPGSERLPESILGFVHTSEFLNLANHEEADFSGVILTYAKAFETILDETIGKPFVESYGGKRPRFSKRTDPFVKHLFPIQGKKRRSIGIGQWYVILGKMKKSKFENSDPTNSRFATHLGSFGNRAVEMIRKYSRALAETRNGAAHLSQFDKGFAQEKLTIFRKAIVALAEIFY